MSIQVSDEANVHERRVHAVTRRKRVPRLRTVRSRLRDRVVKDKRMRHKPFFLQDKRRRERQVSSRRIAAYRQSRRICTITSRIRRNRAKGRTDIVERERERMLGRERIVKSKNGMTFRCDRAAECRTAREAADNPTATVQIDKKRQFPTAFGAIEALGRRHRLGLNARRKGCPCVSCRPNGLEIVRLARRRATNGRNLRGLHTAVAHRKEGRRLLGIDVNLRHRRASHPWDQSHNQHQFLHKGADYTIFFANPACIPADSDGH